MKDDDQPQPESLRGPLIRWWNTVPLPIRTTLKWAWHNRTVRWILVILLVVFLGGLVAQAMGLLNTLLKFFLAIFEAIVHTTVGRFIALNVTLIAVTVLLYRKVRAKANYLLAARAVDRYLSGLRNMVHKRFALGRHDLQVVVDTAKIVDLNSAVAGFPDLFEDALLKLAFCHAELGDIPAGMQCLESVPRTKLSARASRTFDEVHALLYDKSDDFLPETKAAELTKALGADSRNVRLLRALVGRQAEMENYHAAAATQKKLLSALGKGATAKERRRHAFLLYRHAEQLLSTEGGTVHSEDLSSLDPDRRKKVVAELNRAIKVYPELSLPYLLLGSLHAATGNLSLALQTWGRHPSPPALQQVRQLLDDSSAERNAQYREVVSGFPTAGALLAIADHAARSDDHELARKILARLVEEGITSPAQELLHGDVLAAAGDAAGAEQRYQAGVAAFLQTG